MITLTLDERTLLTIRNALWLTQTSAAVAGALIDAQVKEQMPAPPVEPPPGKEPA